MPIFPNNKDAGFFKNIRRKPEFRNWSQSTVRSEPEPVEPEPEAPVFRRPGAGAVKM